MIVTLESKIRKVDSSRSGLYDQQVIRVVTSCWNELVCFTIALGMMNS